MKVPTYGEPVQTPPASNTEGEPIQTPASNIDCKLLQAPPVINNDRKEECSLCPLSDNCGTCCRCLWAHALACCTAVVPVRSVVGARDTNESRRLLLVNYSKHQFVDIL